MHRTEIQASDSPETARGFDEAFLQHLVAIEGTYKRLPRALQIRVERWVVKLSEPCSNDSFRRNRNLHAALLASMVQQAEFTEPFHGLPPEGKLHRLPNHLVSVMLWMQPALRVHAASCLNLHPRSHSGAREPSRRAIVCRCCREWTADSCLLEVFVPLPQNFHWSVICIYAETRLVSSWPFAVTHAGTDSEGGRATGAPLGEQRALRPGTTRSRLWGAPART